MAKSEFPRCTLDPIICFEFGVYLIVDNQREEHLDLSMIYLAEVYYQHRWSFTLDSNGNNAEAQNHMCSPASGYSTIHPAIEPYNRTHSRFGKSHLPQAISTEEKELYPVSEIQSLYTFDPFADAGKGDDLLPAHTEDYIHTQIQQRNSRKTPTTVQGIADDYNKKKLVKAFKNNFACHGTVIEHSEYGDVIQLQGDQRKNIWQFLIEIGRAKDGQLKVHGF
uniref:eukaryotic translation initiation factor 1-like n=1 Tax=Jaculus jaculus TaxID=51337 RepID=UPI001E1B4A90|nr:eukaryotic translation initiation factor 1-like [Jaculus jaculus]